MKSVKLKSCKVGSVAMDGFLLNLSAVFVYELGSSAYVSGFAFQALKSLSAVTDMVPVIWLFQALRICHF